MVYPFNGILYSHEKGWSIVRANSIGEIHKGLSKRSQAGMRSHCVIPSTQHRYEHSCFVVAEVMVTATLWEFSYRKRTKGNSVGYLLFLNALLVIPVSLTCTFYLFFGTGHRYGALAVLELTPSRPHTPASTSLVLGGVKGVHSHSWQCFLTFKLHVFIYLCGRSAC